MGPCFVIRICMPLVDYTVPKLVKILSEHLIRLVSVVDTSASPISKVGLLAREVS